MKRFLQLLFPLLWVAPCFAGSYDAPKTNPLNTSPYKIAILDTGYDPLMAGWPLKVCKSGSFDYGRAKPGVGSSDEKHGTFVATIIASLLREVNYCAVVFQVVGPDGDFSTENIVDALERARKAGVKAVNLSFRSGFYDWYEYAELKKLSDEGIKIFVAAGNETMNLNEACNVFPACYELDNLITVGALTPDGDTKTSYTNYGRKVRVWLPGDLMTPYGYMRGTSFASPRALGQYVRSLYQKAAPHP